MNGIDEWNNTWTDDGIWSTHLAKQKVKQN